MNEDISDMVKNAMIKNGYLKGDKNMENKNFIKVQKISNPQKTYYQISYLEILKYKQDDVLLSYDISEKLQMHLKVMELENKLGVKATYEGFDMSDYSGTCIFKDTTELDKIFQQIKNINKNKCIKMYENLDLEYKMEDLYKENEELKNQWYVSEEFNKELYNENYKMYEKYIKLDQETIKLYEDNNTINQKHNVLLNNYIKLYYKNSELINENIKLNGYLTQHKNNIYNLQDKINKLENEKYNLELKLADYKDNSILLDKIRWEYNKTKCIPRFVFDGKNYVEEYEFLKINMELNYEKHKNQFNKQQLSNVGDIKVKILLDDFNLKNAMDTNFNDNINRLRKRLSYIGSKINED